MTNREGMLNAMDYFIKHEASKDYIETHLVIRDIISDEKLFGSLMAAMQFIMAAMGPEMFQKFFESIFFIERKYTAEELWEITHGIKK